MEISSKILKPKELIIRPNPVAIAELNRLESHRIIACPNAPDVAIESGKAIAIPYGEFDIDLILNQLKFQPELVSLSARVMSFLPRGLQKLDCPKVMKIGDTFHLGDGSLSGMIDYCRSLNCDYHWTYQSVHHLHFFSESGLKNIFWLPGTIVIDEYIPSKPKQKLYDVIFRGGKSELHTYRKYILHHLQRANIPIDIQSKSYTECLEDYAKARIVVNCSLNGDLNRRVYEVLMAGGFLLTDRISKQTGLFELFQEGIHFECYGNPSELIEKIQFYLAHPEQAERIAATGQQAFLNHYRQQDIQQKIYRYIFTNEIESHFTLKHDRRFQNNRTATTLRTRTKTYEIIQELHRLHPELNLLYWRGQNHNLLADLVDLPRLNLYYAHENSMKSWCDALGISSRINFITPDDIETSFQLVLIDACTSLSELEKQVHSVTSLITHSGFLFIIGAIDMIKTLQLNQSLSNQNLFPIELSVELFGQVYPMRLDSYSCLYQKREPTLEINLPSNLIIQEISLKKMIKNQIKDLPIVNRTTQFIRRWLFRIFS